MKIYESCFNVLKLIIKEKVTFSSAIVKNAKGLNKEEYSKVSSLCGYFLRNYFSIVSISNLIFKTKEIEPMIYIGLVYSNNSNKKIVDEKESLKFLENKLALYQVKFNDDVKVEFDKAIKDKREYLKEGLKDKKLTYLSCRTNLPEWIINMLFRQYGRDIAIKIINSLVRMPSQYVVINNLVEEIDASKLLEDFKEVDTNFFEYKQKTSIRKNEFVKSGKAYPIQKAEFDMVKNLPELENKEIAFYFEEKNSLYIALMNKYLESNHISLATKEPKNNQELFVVIKPANYDKLDIYESDENCLISYLSTKQDLLVFMPESSNFELLRRSPEYGINFDTSRLDGIIKNEEQELNDITQYVNVDGYLVYCLPTFDIKETLVTTKKFLEANSNFKLVKEVACFPNEKENSIFYYAIFKKER